MRLATEIICILFGRARNCTEKEIQKQNFTISCRRICRCYMILQKDRDMKFGIEIRDLKEVTEERTTFQKSGHSKEEYPWRFS